MINTQITLLDPVDEQLLEVETLLLSQVDAHASGLELALAQLIEAGGKRIRPRIALLTGSMLGADPGQLLYLAAAIEMLHTASLVHDDLIDGALLRRGMETLNAGWSPSASVLAGDFAFTRAAQLILGTRSFPAIDLFNETMVRMVSGEITQLARRRSTASREEYYLWIRAKTASMFELASGAAALLSPGKAGLAETARRFGYGTGMAFQIVDDILDFAGDQATLGKPVGNDLLQGTITLPALYYLEAHPDEPILRAVINRNAIDKASLAGLITSICRSQAICQCLEDAHDFLRDALEALNGLPDGVERQALAEIATSTLTRST